MEDDNKFHGQESIKAEALKETLSSAETSCSVSYESHAVIMGGFYSHPGSADRFIAELNEVNPVLGALFSACMSYYRGNLEAAEAALSDIKDDENPDVFITVSHILSILAIYRGDTAKWRSARRRLETLKCTTAEERALMHFNLAVMDCGVFSGGTFPEWLRLGCFDYLPAKYHPCARYAYVKWLYMSGKLDLLAAVAEPLISQSRVERSMISEVYLRIIATMGYYLTNNRARAEMHLRAALELALPDRIYSPFAEYRRSLGLFLDQILKQIDSEALHMVINLNTQILSGWTKVYNDLYNTKYTNELTPREYETASLACHGFSNAQIAEKIGVSVNAVKLYLRTAYQKLSVSSREELAPFFWSKP